VSWSTPFDEPIRLRGRRQARHAAARRPIYIMKLPEDVQQEQRWQIAVEKPDQTPRKPAAAG